ncbi:hypothetical protein [Streptomyces sp. NPDC054787]
MCVDSTVVRARQAGRGQEKMGSQVHLACDGRGRLLAFTITGATLTSMCSSSPS